jgi:menaquinone-9 beta-reductase
MAVPVSLELETRAMTAATIAPASAAKDWDAIVIGAGPAGSLAARGLALRGADVLLVDKSAFPRGKVCGCCLNRRTIDTLLRLGLGDLPHLLGGSPLSKLRLVSVCGRQATIPLSGIAISRNRLDDALVQRAIEAGAAFLPACAASVGECTEDFRQVHLHHTTRPAHARVVIAADGLAGTSLAHVDGLRPVIAQRGRIGVAAMVGNPPPTFDRGAITMVCGRYGYVGAVHVEKGSLDIAAAIDPAWMKSVGGPGQAVACILDHAGINLGCDRFEWHGTPMLTRRRRVEAGRLIVIGDAAGYVEPFTGEGMAWATASAEAAAGYAVRTIRREPHPASWRQVHRSVVGRGQRECRLISRVLRHQPITSAAIAVLAAMPSLAAPIVRRINSGRERDAASEAVA